MIRLFVILVLLTPANVLAQTQTTETPKMHPSRLFRTVGLPVLLAGETADTITTYRALSRPRTVESNPLMAGWDRPSITGVKLVTTVASGYFLDRLARTRPKLATTIGVAVGLTLSAVAYHNTTVNRPK